MSLKYETKRFKGLGLLQFTRYGIIHRVDGPASSWDDSDLYWDQYGKKHRSDGPAVKRGQWSGYYIWDVEYTKEEYESKIRSLL